MKSCPYILSGLALLLSLFVGQTAVAQGGGPRDLSRYRQGGTFDLGYGYGVPGATEGEEKAREFLWENWRRRRLAHCVVISRSVEGDQFTISYYVERDSRGRWAVAAEWESECCWNYALEPEERERVRETGRGTYEIVERVEEVAGGKGGWRAIPERERRRPDTYRLRLRKAALTQEGGTAAKPLLL